MKKPTGWGAGGWVVLFVVEVARVELASKYVNYSATTGLVGCCTLRPALHDFPSGNPEALLPPTLLMSSSWGLTRYALPALYLRRPMSTMNLWGSGRRLPGYVPIGWRADAHQMQGMRP